MSGNSRQEGYQYPTLRYGAASGATASGPWPLSVQYQDFGVPVGVGAAFEYRFGRSEDALTVQNGRAQASKALLLVDGVRLTRECLSHLLSTQLPDFEIVSVPHARLAVEGNGGTPDVVLLNVGSARLADGPLLNEIATISSTTRRAPILLLSEHSEPSEEMRAAEFGMVGLFPLTFGVSLLVAAIHLVVAGGQFHIPVASARSMPTRLEANGGRRGSA